MVRNMIFAIALGDSFEEMEKTISYQKYHTCGFDMGYAIGILSDYTIYGNDIRVWWNRRYNICDDGIMNGKSQMANMLLIEMY